MLHTTKIVTRCYVTRLRRSQGTKIGHQLTSIPKNGDNSMDSVEFSLFRKKLQKTQKELAQLLGTSLKAIHSYEQAWRTIPPHVERQLFYLVLKKRGLWTIKKTAGPSKNAPGKHAKPALPGNFNQETCVGLPVVPSAPMRFKKSGPKKCAFAAPAKFLRPFLKP